MGSDGLGLLVSQNASGPAGGTHLTHCADAWCASATTTFLTGAAGSAAVAAGSDGRALVAYALGPWLEVAHCTDLACTMIGTTQLDSGLGFAGESVGLAIGADGRGLISYHDGTRGDLKVAHCQNVSCTSATVTVLDSGTVAADLSVFLHADLGFMRDLTYTIFSENWGTDAATSVTITQTLPAEMVYLSAGGTGWSCGHASGTVTCTRPAAPYEIPRLSLPNVVVELTVPPTLDGVFSSTATISSAVFDPVLSNNASTEEVSVHALPAAQLSVTKSDGGVIGRWGEPFTWTITAANLGSNLVAFARVTDAFPAAVHDVVWTCVLSEGGTCAGGAGDLDAPLFLAGGATATFTATGTLSPFTYGLTNTATIVPPPDYYDPDLSDNTATVISRVEPVQAYTLAPCRVVDTRSAQAPALAANTVRTFPVGGLCGVPADARAVIGILTAVNPGDVGDLRLFPAGTFPSPLASAVNFMPGRTRAGSATVPLGPEGQVWVQCDMPIGSLSSTHFVLDVYGYLK
jgi:hypothetical protein